MTDLEPIPLIIRTRLAHAALQAIADECGADILHIKGAAVDPSLLPQREDAPPNATPEQRSIPRASSDADILVRPSHIRRFQKALKKNGWHAKTSLYSRGAVEHSADWWHPQLGSADVHVRFPGIRLAQALAFDRLWGDYHPHTIAQRACPVPNLDAQVFLLMINAARAGGTESKDVRRLWASTSQDEKIRIESLARGFGAEVALAGATGTLGRYSDRPEYDLWRLLAEPDADVFRLWIAYVKAAPTPCDRIRAVIYPLHVKSDRIHTEQHQESRYLLVLRAHCDRLRRGFIGTTRMVRETARNRVQQRPRHGRKDSQ